jgi:DHA1 family inner membrane transport protein
MRIPAIVYVLALGAFALITTEFGVIGILPQISEAFRITIDRAGWLLSGFALVIALLGPWMTLLFSKVNRKFSLSLVLFAFFLSNIASVFSPTFNVLLLARLLPAFVHPVFWSIAMSVAAASVETKRSSRAVSIVFTGFSAGIVLGVPMASFVAGSYGWEGAFLVFSVLNAVALIAHLILIPSMPVTRRLSFGSQLGVLRKPILWLNLALQVLLTAAVFSIYAYMADYLKIVTEMDVRSISLMLFLFGTAGFFGTLAAGSLMGPYLSATASGFMALFAPTLFLIFLFGQSYPVAVVLVVIWGFVHAPAVPLCQALILRAAPEAPEFSNSLFNSFGNLGLTAGTMVGGFFISFLGIRVLPLASISLLAVAALVFLMERRLYARQGRAQEKPRLNQANVCSCRL